jgi:hypothetical protein
MARVTDTDADGKTTVAWLNLPTRTGPHPLVARAAHRARILAMTDGEILIAVAGDGGINGSPAERADFVRRIRTYAAISPAHAAKVFLAGRWTPATADRPTTAAIA